MSAYKQVVAKRDAYTVRFNTFSELATRALQEPDAKRELRACRGSLAKIFAEYEAVQMKIISAIDEDEEKLNTEHVALSRVESQYYSIVGICMDLFDQPNIVPGAGRRDAEVSHVRLPKIALPNFDGDFRAWNSFIDRFKQLFHTRESLSPVEKFQYLLSSLSGEPLRLIDDLEITDANYDIAYALLIERYENKRLTLQQYWSAIKEIKPATSHSPSSLRSVIDSFSKIIDSLKVHEPQVESWNFVWVNMILDKVDNDTRIAFELSHTSTEFPTLAELKKGLNERCNSLASISYSTASSSTSPNHSKHGNPEKSSHNIPKSRSVFLANTTPSKTRCVQCSDSHALTQCPSFLSQNERERFMTAKRLHLCINCLGSGHQLSTCKSTYGCRKCRKNHHSLLHFEFGPSAKLIENTGPAQGASATASAEAKGSLPAASLPPVFNSLARVSDAVGTIAVGLTSTVKSVTVLLATAAIKVRDRAGNCQIVRAIIDPGSQASFITDRCRKRLSLSCSNTPTTIQGLGNSDPLESPGAVTCRLAYGSHLSSQLVVEAIVLPEICPKMPTSHIDTSQWGYLANVQVADDSFNTPGNVDMLLGAEIYPLIIREGIIAGTREQPTAFNTVFGWILMGEVRVEEGMTQSVVNSHLAMNPPEPVDVLIRKFWEIEEGVSAKFISPADEACEVSYTQNVARDVSGRYAVALPFKKENPRFVGSRAIALTRFSRLEASLLRQPAKYAAYSEFMRDYLQTQHMSLAQESTSEEHYFIPHHCVLKPDSTTTKLRVVFDASAKDARGNSLNDHLQVGENLLKDLSLLLLRFRCHRVAFTADIRQMYRQIEVTPEHRKYQKIVWRFSPEETIREYELNTVTYGVVSSPFLAQRTLRQLAEDEGAELPCAAKVLKNDVYMDDVLTGSESARDALTLQYQVIDLLKRGGFELRKWASNEKTLLDWLAADLRQGSLSFDKSTEIVKILGLRWNPVNDGFSYHVEIRTQTCTKRHILSELARIFDPLGFVSPLTFFAKHLMQYLWCLGLSWDDSPPSEVVSRWQEYCSQLHEIAKISVPRWLCVSHLRDTEMHGFCDASEKGYAAVVYLRHITTSGEIKTILVAAKSKVAPLKRLTIPRLELCAALLLAKLIKLVHETLQEKIRISSIFAWSDSTVTLTWIRSSPHRWPTFVSNRAKQIQDCVPPESWKHVRTHANPADCASRGLMPGELVRENQWWAGPGWLSQPKELWPVDSPDLYRTAENIRLCEEKKWSLTVVVKNDKLLDLLDKYSSLEKIQRIVAYGLRFVNNSRNPQNRQSGTLKLHELHDALLYLVYAVQESCFSSELADLAKGKVLSKHFRRLNPFRDNRGILRVGGRLAQSQLPFEHKHPALLPKEHRLTRMIIDYYHRVHLHPGIQTLQFLLSQHFWIIGAKTEIRRGIAKCLNCFKTRPIAPQPPMAPLPSARVSKVKAFQHVGVDYGGPFSITLVRRRGTKSQKAYLCLFVCFATKALHLELASDLTEEAFLAALRRFIARRGRCTRIYSDCGRNFVGANRELTNLFKKVVEGEKIEWSFNPPSAPHFGGLWEAGIKSVKSHIKRVVGDQILTYEELTTLLAQIEALLNSRPLWPMSTDPNDCQALTPGHFLMLEPVSAIPDRDLSNVKLNALSRWQLVQKLNTSFWTRWRKEYLNTLQQRTKWFKPTSEFAVGRLVYIKDNLAPPLEWRLARVVALHPGADGVNRVATVRTTTGTLQRPVVKLCPLPYQ